MARYFALVWRLASRFVILSRLGRRLRLNPFDFVSGKPLERWLLVYDLGKRQLALGNDRNTVTTVMHDRAGTFPKSAALEALLSPLIGQGVFGQAGGPKVKAARRLFIRALAELKDADIADISRRTTASYVERWLRRGSTSPLPLCSEMSRLTVDIVSQCVLHARFDPEESEQFAQLFWAYHEQCAPLSLLFSDGTAHAYARLIRAMGLQQTGREIRKLVLTRFLAPLLAGKSEALSAPFARCLASEGYLGSPTVTADTLQHQALDEITVMLLAGHETTASVMNWLSWELAQQPATQDAAAARLDETAAGRDYEADPAAFRHWIGIDAETLTTGLIQEALRLYPPIAFFLRETTEESRFRGKPLPRGSFFVVSPWILQRHRKTWERPDEFVPERWWNRQSEPARATFMPFGMGPRVCPGARFADIEMRAILQTLLSRCRFTPASPQSPKPLGSLTSRPDREIYLTVSARPRCRQP